MMNITIIIPDRTGDSRQICTTEEDFQEGMKNVEMHAIKGKNVTLKRADGKQQMYVPKYTGWDQIVKEAREAEEVMITNPISAG